MWFLWVKGIFWSSVSFSWKQSGYQSGTSWRGSGSVQFKWHCRGWREEGWADNLQNLFQPVGTALFPDRPLVKVLTEWKSSVAWGDRRSLHHLFSLCKEPRIFLVISYPLALSPPRTMSHKCKTSGRSKFTVCSAGEQTCICQGNEDMEKWMWLMKLPSGNLLQPVRNWPDDLI